MEKNMKINFLYLKQRVEDALENTDLEYIRYQLRKIQDPTIVSGVGGSSVVSNFGSKILERKNQITSINSEPRDFLYRGQGQFKNVIACSYSGNNYGVDLSFQQDLKKYLLSNNQFDDKEVTYLTYRTTIDKERSFISLGATLIPISILLDYYVEGNDKQILSRIEEKQFNTDRNTEIYEIFTGYDTSTTSKYLESTFVEAGLGIPIIHDKYSYCHGRSTLSTAYPTTAIYLNRGTDFDKLLLEELKPYYEDIIVIDGMFEDPILDDYQMLIQAFYLTKSLAEKKEIDLSKIEYCPIVKQLYKYRGNI